MTNSCNFKVFFEEKNITLDQVQQRVAIDLNKYLLEQKKKKNLFNFFSTKKPKHNGIYLWGSVGCGKTILLDYLFELLPSNKKVKLHFHEFMQYVHSLIFTYRNLHKSGNIIAQVAVEIAKKYKYIYLDELDIQDITDAMMVGKLFQEIFKLNTNFLITSNREPKELYKNGLQREFFLKFISVLEENIEVISLLSYIDYRYLNDHQFKSHYFPLTPENLKTMEEQFLKATNNHLPQQQNFLIGNRIISCNKAYRHIAWFEFSEIFLTTYSNADYMVFINSFEVIFINAIPEIKAESRNVIKRLINFIDLAYNKKTILIWSSSHALEDIYTKGEELFEFKRTLSRLTEMQTSSYIGSRL